jgi:hypothetical protein
MTSVSSSRPVRLALLILNLGLAWIFALALSVLIFAPVTVERQGHEELVRRISSAATERYPALRTARWTDALDAAMRRDTAELRATMTSPELEMVTAVLSRMCRHDCQDEETVANALREGIAVRLQPLDRATQRVEDWARGHYRDLADEIIVDLRIFCATNLVLCILAAFAARVRGRDRAVVFASAILTMTVTLAAWFYLFEQHWLQTVLFADYVGFGYVIWVLLIGGSLFDVAFNEGKVVGAVVNAVGGAIGALGA